MNWRHVKLIFRRELRDQLRDRRTLFLIAVLPILFYPLLGISFFQIAQFLREHASKVLIVGHEETRSDLPALIEKGRLAPELLDSQKANVLELKFLSLDQVDFIRSGKWSAAGMNSSAAQAELNLELQQLMRRHGCDAVIFFPPKFFQQLEAYFKELPEHARHGTGEPPAAPQPQVVYDTSSEKRGLAHFRVSLALDEWSLAVGKRSLQLARMPGNASAPIGFTQFNIADGEQRINTTLWSKILPFVLLIWAVTGAFYPAVDLCAGEKERGTLETLLSSPAQRSEIVMGKLLTVMVFSIVTAVLNLVSICVTGAVVMSRLKDMAEMADIGAPPIGAVLWLSLILIPVSALFSAVCLALAAFARSTKEGQYYLMPVVMVTMPLILLPMKPDAELNLGFSLIPVSGIVLLMRSIMEGTINELWPYAFPVAAVTFGCCWLAVRWAIDQFNSEEVLFREGERWDIRTWVRHLIHDRLPSPTIALAVLCGVLVLIVKFFLPGFIDAPKNMDELQRLTVGKLAEITLMTQLLMVLAPAVILAVITTRRPARALNLNKPPLFALPAAGLLALALFPLVIALQLLMSQFFEPRPEVQQYSKILESKLNEAPIWFSVLLIALLPAVCEELTFRGFILSGFRHTGHKWRAIAFTAFFFAVSHPLFEQMINAFFLGLVLGYLAIQTGSVWPSIIYHFAHNAALYLSKRVGLMDQILADDLYAGLALCIGTLLAVVIVFWFDELSYGRTKEEALQEAIQRDSVQSRIEPA